ncbi:hypothetical protein LIER_24445 [Lithospermum erythrorhizon]|uniref:Retrotransposon gag domain-containing protein n=1 Tax=Lithospermum erythrorhizon TaxID=34254 RepID=A0AAV3R123_LITER
MPFTDMLDAVPLPKGFVLSQFTQFGGSGDPIKYLQGILAKMKITSNNPNIYAKTFSNSLNDKALDWYMELLLKSIDTYQQNADAFIAKFGSAIQAHHDERALMDMEQGPTKTLKSYHKPYNDILLTIPKVNNKVAYMVFYNGLKYGKLKKPEPPPLAGRINTIGGGIVGGGDSRNSRKNYARREVYSIAEPTWVKNEAISFFDKELAGIELPHDDPVDIAPIIANFIVEQMLVDAGSSMDVLYLITFDKLSLPQSLIQPLHTPLTEFTSHTI